MLIKFAAPKWFKVFKNKTKFFDGKIQADFALGELKHSLENRKLAEPFFVSTKIMDPLSVPIKERAARTFKIDDDHVIQFLEHKNSDQSYGAKQIGRWLKDSTKNVNAADEFKFLRSRQSKLPIAHFSLNKNLSSGDKFYSLSSAREGRGGNKIFSIPDGEHVPKVMEGYKHNIENTVSGRPAVDVSSAGTIVSRVPIHRLRFRGNNTMGGGPEVISTWSDFAAGIV